GRWRTAFGLEEPRRETHAAGDAAHLLLDHARHLAPGVFERSENQVFQEVRLGRIHHARIDRDRGDLLRAVHRDLHLPAAGGPYELARLQLRLHLGHLGLERLGLLHHLLDVHDAPLPWGPGFKISPSKRSTMRCTSPSSAPSWALSSSSSASRVVGRT